MAKMSLATTTRLNKVGICRLARALIGSVSLNPRFAFWRLAPRGFRKQRTPIYDPSRSPLTQPEKRLSGLVAASPNKSRRAWDRSPWNRSRRADSLTKKSSADEVLAMTAYVDHQPQPSGPELYGVRVYVPAVCGFWWRSPKTIWLIARSKFGSRATPIGCPTKTREQYLKTSKASSRSY